MSAMEEQSTVAEDHPFCRDEERPGQNAGGRLVESSESDSESESESDNQNQREGSDEAYDSSKYPNPKSLTGYELKRAFKISHNAECLYRLGTLSKDEFDREIARAWKLNEGAVPPTKKRKNASATKTTRKDSTPSIPVRRSKRKVKPVSSFAVKTTGKDSTPSIPVRRSKRKVKPVNSFTPSHPSSHRRSTRNAKEVASEAILLSQNRERNEGTNTDSDDQEAADSPPADNGPNRNTTKGNSRDPCWTTKEHGLFVDGLQRYAEENDAPKKWRKIAVYVETKTAQEVRDYARLTNSKCRQVFSQDVLQHQSERVGTDMMTKIVQSTSSEQPSI